MPNIQDDSFSNRYVVLTGAGRAGQTGEVIAREFALRGAHVILIDRNPANVAERLHDMRTAGFEATGFDCDLSMEPEVGALAARIAAVCGHSGIAALVNAAGGFAMSGNVAESASDVWNRMFSINLTTTYLVTRALLPLLRKGRGAIVNFATGAVLPGQRVAGMSAYVAAKGGVAHLTRAIAQEEKDSGVRANAIAPSAIRTLANMEAMGSDVRYVERETVAETILFLCSSAASAINGEVIRLA